jgi:hypothetical protein
LARSAEEVPADGIRGCVSNGVDQAIHSVPAAGESFLEPSKIFVAIDVEFENVRCPRKAAGSSFGDPAHPPEAGQDHLGPRALRALGDRVGDRAAIDDAGDQDSLALDDHR